MKVQFQPVYSIHTPDNTVPQVLSGLGVDRPLLERALGDLLADIDAERAPAGLRSRLKTPGGRRRGCKSRGPVLASVAISQRIWLHRPPCPRLFRSRFELTENFKKASQLDFIHSVRVAESCSRCNGCEI